MIHPTAVIDACAELAADVQVGPYSIIGPDVSIDTGTVMGPHVVIMGPTHIGKNNRIFQFSSIGDIPQDKKFAGEVTRLEIGEGNMIREYVTINRGTVQGGGLTRVGSHNWIMAYVHMAHDCLIGDHTIFANNTNLAGHVVVEDYAILGGATLVHQFCRIGAHSFCAKGTGISRDVPPYVMVAGHFGKPYGLNSEGLKRQGFSKDSLQMLKKSYKLLYRSKLSFKQSMLEIETLAQTDPQVERFYAFIKSSERGIVR